MKYDPRGWTGLLGELKGKTIERYNDSLVLVKADRRSGVVFNQTKRLSTIEWTAFEQLLRKAGLWRVPATSEDRGNDGSEWVIESLQKDKYRFVARWSPGDAFRDAGV